MNDKLTGTTPSEKPLEQEVPNVNRRKLIKNSLANGCNFWFFKCNDSGTNLCR
jgi:hypothetical protein